MNTNPKVTIVSFLRPGVGEKAFQGFQERLSAAVDEISVNVVARNVVSSLDEAGGAIKTITDRNPDLVILYFSNYIREDIPLTLIRHTDFPVLFWVVSGQDAAGLPLSGFISTTSNLKRLGKSVNYVLGAPEDVAVHREIEEWAKAALSVRRLNATRIGLIGHNPPGMIDVTLNELELSKLGLNVLKLDLLELARETEAIEEEVYREIARTMAAEFEKSIEVEKSDLERSARLYAGLRSMIRKNSLDVVAVRCWPELIQRFGTTICLAFSKLADQNEAIGVCEADSTGAASMVIASLLCRSPAFIGDLSTTIPEDEAIQLWHCGAAPTALADPSGKIRLTHHGLRPGVGVQCSFPLRPGPVTLLKLLRPIDGVQKMFVGIGDAIPTSLDKGEARYGGNIVNVRVRPNLRSFIDRIVECGVEHHLVMAYGDTISLVGKFCRLFEIEEVKAT